MTARIKWPPIAEQKLIERLELDDAAFPPYFERFAERIGPREFDDRILRHALAYPWARPEQSFVLRNQQVQPIAELPEERRAALSTGRLPEAAAVAERFPLLAFGSNGSPDRLIAKLEHLAGGHQDVIAISGELHDFDVGASAHSAIYGACPATIFDSPGTAIRASVLWLTLEQLTAIAWTEVSYHLGALDEVNFVPDFEAPAISSVLAFVSRWGAVSINGDVVALEAIEARGRTATGYSQQRLLDQLAPRAFDAAATASDVVRNLHDDYAGAFKRLRAPLGRDAVRFSSERWSRLRG